MKSVITVSLFTLRDIIRSKIMVSTLFLGIFLVAFSSVSSKLTYGVPYKIALDVGLGVLSLSTTGIALFLGATLLPKELENRTIYLVLSRPINRFSFLLGKYFGLSIVLFFNVFTLGMLTIFVYLSHGGLIHESLFLSLFFIFLESLTILTIVLFLSLFTNTTLSVICGMAIYIISYMIDNALKMNFVQESNFLRITLEFYSIFLPNLGDINIKKYLLYESALRQLSFAMPIISIVFYNIIVLFSSVLVFNHKNLE